MPEAPGWRLWRRCRGPGCGGPQRWCLRRRGGGAEPARRPGEPLVRVSPALFDLDGGAGLPELRLDRVGLVLGDALLDRLRGRVDEILRLLQAEARDRADDLDHLDLLLARIREDDVERRLLLGGRSAVAGESPARSSHCDGRRGRDAPLVLDLLLQLDQVENGHLPELVEHLVDRACSHRYCSSSAVSGSCVVSSVCVSSACASVSVAASEVGSSVGTGEPPGSPGAPSPGPLSRTGGSASAPSPPSWSMRASSRPYRSCSGA